MALRVVVAKMRLAIFYYELMLHTWGTCKLRKAHELFFSSLSLNYEVWLMDVSWLLRSARRTHSGMCASFWFVHTGGTYTPINVHELFFNTKKLKYNV